MEKRPANVAQSKRSQGFTLVELLIYMGLLTMLVVVFTDIFTSIIDNQLSSTNNTNVADDGRFIYSRFIYDVNRAQAIIEPENIGSSSSSMTLTINGENHTYTLSNGKLAIVAPSGSDWLNGYGTEVSGLLFTKVGTDSAKQTVRINYTVEGLINIRGISDRQSFQTTAGLR